MRAVLQRVERAEVRRGRRLAAAPGELAAMAAAAKSLGVLDAAERLADVVMAVAGL